MQSGTEQSYRNKQRGNINLRGIGFAPSIPAAGEGYHQLLPDFSSDSEDPVREAEVSNRKTTPEGGDGETWIVS